MSSLRATARSVAISRDLMRLPRRFAPRNDVENINHMHFIDEVKIYIKGGNGGNGCVSFHREKFIDRGGCSWQ